MNNMDMNLQIATSQISFSISQNANKVIFHWIRKIFFLSEEEDELHMRISKKLLSKIKSETDVGFQSSIN